MIDVRLTQVEAPSPSQAIRITLRNGFTYLLLLVAKPMGNFVSYEGFEKFLKEQTLRGHGFTTTKHTMLIEKEQLLLIPALTEHIAYKQPPEQQQLYYSVALYKTDMKKHVAPSEASKVKIPYVQYGMDLFDPLTRQKVGYVSNLVYYREFRYYLCELEPSFDGPVLANSSGYPIGFVIRHSELRICLSCRDLTNSNNDYNQEILTDDFTARLLRQTCYIGCATQYGTGILSGNRKVLTAKHIIPEGSRQLGSNVQVSTYPYRKFCNGTISYIDRVRDYLEIQIQQDVEGDGYGRPDKDDRPTLGADVTAIGFGKYNFQQSGFSEVYMLPTLQKGVVSKVIRHKESSVFIKTSAHLSNGFSGCGIWSSQGLLGMAVFIVLNGAKKLLWHNYSYSCQFLEQPSEEHEGYLRDFDRIYLRSSLPLYPKL